MRHDFDILQDLRVLQHLHSIIDLQVAHTDRLGRVVKRIADCD